MRTNIPVKYQNTAWRATNLFGVLVWAPLYTEEGEVHNCDICQDDDRNDREFDSMRDAAL